MRAMSDTISSRMIRVNELIKRVIGERLFRIFDETDFDVGAITVTRVETSKDLREASVFVSIREHKTEREKMLKILSACRAELQKYINKEMKLKYTPKLSFFYDDSLETGDRVLAIINSLNIPDDTEEEI